MPIRPMHPGSVWIDQNYDTLPANEWIAADKDGLVAHDPSHDELKNKLRSRGIDLSDVVIMFVPGGIVQ